jgi:hypothetical protein
MHILQGITYGVLNSHQPSFILLNSLSLSLGLAALMVKAEG